MTWKDPVSCELCGTTDGCIRIGIVHWPDRPPGMQYEHLAKCVDLEGCRARAIANGRPWPKERKKVPV